MARLPALINVMTSAARKAARGLARDFGEVEQLQVSRKGPADFVSNADRKAEAILREELSHARKDFALVMEESGTTERAPDAPRWIVDPLDGTTNFLHGLPHFAVSIGVEERGEITAGVVYDVIKDEMFWAARGQGAWLNERRLRVSARSDLSTALIATGAPYQGHGDPVSFSRCLAQIMPRVAGIRRYGAASLDLAYVAAGRYEGFWEEGLSPWDLAAGIILVKEAGGHVIDTSGRQQMMQTGNVIATNDVLNSTICDLVQKGLDGP